MSDRFAAPKKTKKLRKTVLKVNTDRKDEYIFFLEYVILHYQKNAFTVFENLKLKSRSTLRAKRAMFTF